MKRIGQRFGMKAADRWAAAWPGIAAEIEGVPLPEAHQVVCQRAEGLLPFRVEEKLL